MEVGHTCRASPHGVSAQRGALGWEEAVVQAS